MSHNHAKMLLSQRLAELACTDKKSLENKSTFYQTKSENNKTDMNLAHTGNSALPDLLKIEQFNDIFNKSQIEALKKIGVLFSYQLLALSMIELNRCGISVMQIVKIQEKIKKTDNIKVFNTDNTNTELAVGMQSDGNKNSLQGCVKDTYFEKLSPPEFSTHLLCNMETEDCEEECDLIIDEEACSTSDGDIEFSKPDIKNNAKENYVKQSTELQNSNKQNTQSLKEVEVKDLSKHSEIFYKKIQKVSKIVATDFPLKYNDDKLNTNESNVRKITKCDPLLVEINDYAKPLRKISTNINTLEDIKIITTGELDMRLPFNSVLQNYKPATECDGSFVPHSIIPWKLFEIVLPTKVPMSLEQIEKLQQSNDPRIRKRIINQEIYSFEGNFHDLSKEFPMDSNCVSNSVDNNNNDSKNNILYKKDFLDPRKLHISNSTYEHFKQPTVMQTLQYYLHHSTWYNKQNSKAKMEINELIADLAAYLKKFKQDNRLNKKFCLNKLKYHSQILNILNNLKIFIDSNGSILPEKAISDMNYGTENTGFTLFGGFERFWGTLPSNQRQLPVISNLVPVGSFQAPMPVHFNKPALLGFHSNDITGVGCNNSFQATAAAVHTKTMNFANNILYGNQNFTFHFENCRSQFPQSSVALNSNLESFKASNEVNSYGSRNNLKYRNNSKLSDRYSNKKNKRFNNKYCNNSENGGFSNKDNEENISTFENDKNNNKCDVICNKKIKQRRKVSENWDEEDEPIKALEKCASNSETSKTFEGKEENWDSDDENENSINNSSEQKLKDCPVKNFDSINDFGTVSKKQKLENIRCTTTDTEKTSLKSEKSNFENHVCSKSPKHEENLCFANNIEISKVVADDSEEEWD
ncbi:GATA zinc finger domain-containing protein 4-like [Condylostylus longicornis]|uniref:GATA zinc finger domain-containing protein 4-like n=1 Tax=Condylostylus longicornis TaxID=2530218 RepID=UPI00244E4401|nr:GATA zinc finger domain-containing protein 4-like [Condylostylus longicornis]